MGFYLTELTSSTAAETRTAARRCRVSRPTRVGAKTRIGAPIRRPILSTKYLDEETGLYYYGYRYMSPQLGRWLNRDPHQELGGHNLHSFVFNDPVGRLDILGQIPVPLRGNPDLIWDLDRQYRPLGHSDLHGSYGLTPMPQIGDTTEGEKIVKVSPCCAQVERASATKLMLTMLLLTRSTIGTYVTSLGYSELRTHEFKRGGAYLDGYEAFYGPVSGTGSAVLRCGVLCRRAGWREARSLLSGYVAGQRLEAWSQFYAYELRAQAQIGRENRYWGTIDSGGRSLFDRFTQHFEYSPPLPFDKSNVLCPASNL